MAQHAHNQTYDNLLKRMVENQSTIILPLLFPDLVSEVVDELNIELLVPPRRTDRVYRARPADPEDDLSIVHVEFESSANSKMDKRLLIYHALLWEKYDQPITSIIVYPFETSMVCSPLVEITSRKELLRFNYQTLPLWQEDAHRYVEQRAVPLYGFLPAMQGISDELLLAAIDEMVQYYAQEEERLRDELFCFQVLLTRAQRLPETQFQRVFRRVRMFDPLLEQDPWVQGKVAEGELRGELKGELKSSRGILVNIIRTRFPALAELAQAKAAQVEQPEELHTLIEQCVLAPNEEAARWLLDLRPVS